MKAYDQKSKEILEETAKIVCKDEQGRQLLQLVYNLGMADGQTKALKDVIDEGKK